MPSDPFKWSPGHQYGPVLTPTDVYLLQPKVELHPILSHSNKSFHLVFNIASGQTGGFNPDANDRDLPFQAKEESATLPRMTEIVIISRISPWCSIIKNPRGVSLGDICTALWKDYSDHHLTDAEFMSLAPAMQDRVKRTAMTREGGGAGWNNYYQPTPAGAGRCKRVDWLRERVFFDGMEKDDDYAKSRLGFHAPNIFVLSLTS